MFVPQLTTKTMKKIRIENTQDNIGSEIRVFKNDFEIYKHELGSQPYYSISLKNSYGGNNVWGGDSASEDSYSLQLAKHILSQWDGTLHYTGEQYGYAINS